MNFVNWRQLARVMQAMEWLAAGKPVGWDCAVLRLQQRQRIH